MATLPDPAAHTYTPGEVVSAATLLTFVRDALAFFLNAPTCRVYNSAAITVATSTPTALTFNTERNDNDGIHSTSSNTGRLTAVTAGKVQGIANAQFAANATGARALKVRLNGATIIAQDERNAVSTGGWGTTLCVPFEYELAVGDYLDVVVEQTSGGNLNVQASGNFSPEFGMTWVSAA